MMYYITEVVFMENENTNINIVCMSEWDNTKKPVCSSQKTEYNLITVRNFGI